MAECRHQQLPSIVFSIRTSPVHRKRSIFIDLPQPARIEDSLIQMPPVHNGGQRYGGQ
jgi:hypothetical protein